MAKLLLLQQRFERMVQDAPRYELPPNSAWNLVDYIPGLDAHLRKRGGWSYASDDISAIASGATYVNAVAFAPFIAAAKLCAMTDNSKFVTVNITTKAVTLVSASGITTLQTPVFHSDKLIITATNGTTAPKYYDGTTFGNLAGTPPPGKYAAVWKDMTVLSNTSANPTKNYFSKIADPTTWDTTNGWVSTLAPPSGLAALPNALLIFQENACGRIRGSSAPSATDAGDFVLDDPIFTVGCTDARSIAVNGHYCVFANPNGVYLSNGTNIPEDLTEACGIKRYWNSVFSSYSRSTWTIAGGFYRGMYYVSIMNGVTFQDAFCFDVQGRKAWRLSNLKMIGFSPGVAIDEELFMAYRADDRVLSLSSIYSPASGVKNDANGTAVTPLLETPFYLDPRSGKKTWKSIYVTYDMRDAATDNPAITVAYIKTVDGSYTNLSPTLAETTDFARERRYVRLPAHGLGLKLTQANASSDTRIVAVAADVHTREDSRL